MNKKNGKKGKSKKTRIVKLLAVVLAFVFLTIFECLKQYEIEIYENTEISVNETADNYQFIKELKNVKILTEKTEIDTSTVGEQYVYLTVKPTIGKKYDFGYRITVVDREIPKITFNGDLETTEGTEIDLLKGVSATDNSNEEIAVSVEGDYDFTKPGEYSLKYVAIDSSNNKAEEAFKLTVKAKSAPQVTQTEGTSSQTKPETTTQKEKEPSNTTSETVTFTTSKGYQGVTQNGVTYIDGYLVANKTYSLPSTYGTGLTAETKSAFNTMSAAAKKDGLNIYISSGFRSYSTQNRIYNNYVNNYGRTSADTFSARPGHSEHQSGLAVDVNIISDAFIGTPEAIWLNNNCYKYGFILRYPQGKSNETGYKYEPWHFRYVGVDLATKLYNGGDWITMEDYFGITSQYQ
ncbi:MAG: D-alanyl-D-alanine carboxypeptidase family protein [Oscillospiraceae bacterium]|nr:D-alanyl-D-alanine carboxypeptidase family protein [Oscillospiraceae bacterium]